MDVVYFTGPQFTDELRYSLRSLRNFREGVGRVYLMGSVPPPDWLTNVGYIPTPENGKWNNLHDKFVAVQRCDFLSPEIILMEDDNYIVKPTTPVGPCWNNFLQPLAAQHPDTNVGYYQSVRDTQTFMQAQWGIGAPLLSYETHRPFTVDRAVAREVTAGLEGVRPLRMHTYYGNAIGSRVIGHNSKVITKNDLVRLHLLQVSYLSSNDTSFEDTGLREYLDKEIGLNERCEYEQ